MSQDKHESTRRSAFRVGLVAGLLLLSVAAVAVLLMREQPVGGGGVADGASAVARSAEAAAVELAGLGDVFGQLMDRRGDAGPLLDRLDRFVVAHPDNAEAFTLQGQVLAYAQRPEEALAALDRSLALRPGQANVHLLAGGLAMHLGRYDAARRHYQQAVDLEPGHPRHAVFLANALVKLGEDERAEAVLRSALKRDSSLHTAYALLSDIHAERGRLDEALKRIDRALDALPEAESRTRTSYVLKKASLLRRAGRPAESLALLNALPGEARADRTVLRDTAASWGMLDKPAMAAGLYERVLTADPSSDFAAAEAARWWLKAGDLAAARRDLQILQRINPHYGDLPDLKEAIMGN